MVTSQYLDPRVARTRSMQWTGKQRAIEAARAMQAIVNAEVHKSGIDPQYEFLELIGKGAFGRVYKSKYIPTNQVVAVKIIDIDAADFKSRGEDTVKDVLRETAALRALKESNAKNINLIYDAFVMASYVWIVSQYCPGGSVRTLMRATPEPGLNEAYIIPIARELAEALKWVHNAGIIHRDVKAANILIGEDGRVQLCDFGVAGILESKLNKRSTILGTPHYMAPEILDVMEAPVGIEYGNEVDIWAYGCTLYELATGSPPNARIAHEQLRFVVNDQVPRLEGNKYSAYLRDLVELCLEKSPAKRPTIETIQTHPYIFNTEKRYPTSALQRLLYDYYEWERSGGQRVSLFMPGGAPVSDFEKDEEDEWNFSTTEVFDNTFAANAAPSSSAPSNDNHHNNNSRPHLSRSASTSQRIEAHPRMPLNPLERLFIPGDRYNYLERGQGPKVEMPSDLPLREQNENSSRRETLIDAGAFDASTGIATIPDLSTIRGRSKFIRFLRDSDDESEDTVKFGGDQGGDGGAARRATKDWKFPGLAAAVPAASKDSDDEDEDMDDPRRKTQDWKFPVMTAGKGKGKERDVAMTSTTTVPATSMLAEPRPMLPHAHTEPTEGASSYGAYIAQTREDNNDDDNNLASSPTSTIDLDEYISGPHDNKQGSSVEKRNPLDAFLREHGSASGDYDDDDDDEEFNRSFEQQAVSSKAMLGLGDATFGEPGDSRRNSVIINYGEGERVRGQASTTTHASDDPWAVEREDWSQWTGSRAGSRAGGTSMSSNTGGAMPTQHTTQGSTSTDRTAVDFGLEGPLHPNATDREALEFLISYNENHSGGEVRLGDPDFPGIGLGGVGGYLSRHSSLRATNDRGGVNSTSGPSGTQPFSSNNNNRNNVPGVSSTSDADDSDDDSDDYPDYGYNRALPLFQPGPLPPPPSAEVMLEGASNADLARELARTISTWHDNLSSLRASLEASLSLENDRNTRRAKQKEEKKAAKKAKKKEKAALVAAAQRGGDRSGIAGKNGNGGHATQGSAGSSVGGNVAGPSTTVGTSSGIGGGGNAGAATGTGTGTGKTKNKKKNKSKSSDLHLNPDEGGKDGDGNGDDKSGVGNEGGIEPGSAVSE